MRNIERQLKSFVNGTGPKITYDTLCAYADRNPNEVIHILFKVINDELNSITGIGNLDKIRELVQSIGIILANYDDINRGVVVRKLRKLDEKIDRLKIENRKKFVDIQNAFQELEKVRLELEKLESQTAEKDTKQYDFVNYLATKVRNITYLEYTFSKMPNLVNIRDKKEVPLIRNMVEKYIESVKENKEEDVFYYSNLISLIISRKNFNNNEREKQNCLSLLYTALNQLSIGKKQSKKNAKKIEWINYLISTLKGTKTNDSQIKIIAEKYSIQINFSEDILESARLVRVPRIGELTDRDLVEEYAITIDGERAIEIDDALSCRQLPNGNYLVGGHIASPLGYFPYESDIIQNAIKRGCSIYLPKKYQNVEDDFNRIIPLFPHDFCTRVASLLPGEPRLTRSYFFEIDPEGKVVGQDFRKTITRSQKKTTYREINSILENGCSDKDLTTVARNLEAVANILARSNKENELYEQIKENTDDYSELRVKRNGSAAEKIVYQMMLLTGTSVAEFFAANNYPVPYRIHEENEKNAQKILAMIEVLRNDYGGDEYQKLYQLVGGGICPGGQYGTSGSHAGLGKEHYCHITAPLRRAADNVVEHALEVCYDRTPSAEDLALLALEVEQKVAEINAKQNPIDWFVKDYRRSYHRRH